MGFVRSLSGKEFSALFAAFEKGSLILLFRILIFLVIVHLYLNAMVKLCWQGITSSLDFSYNLFDRLRALISQLVVVYKFTNLVPLDEVPQLFDNPLSFRSQDRNGVHNFGTFHGVRAVIVGEGLLRLGRGKANQRFHFLGRVKGGLTDLLLPDSVEVTKHFFS